MDAPEKRSKISLARLGQGSGGSNVQQTPARHLAALALRIRQVCPSSD